MLNRDSSPASLAKVARKAKVSIATASRALNGSSLTVTKTRERVLEAARDLNYKTNRRFRLMGKSHGKQASATGNLGILLPTLHEATFAADPYYGRLFWSMEHAARQYHRHVLISRLSPENPAYLPDIVADAKVDGVLMADRCEPETIKRIQALVPAVLVNALPDGADISVVMPDEASGMVKALDYLRELGHRRIYYFDIQESPSHHHTERLETFVRHCQQLSLAESRSIVLQQRDKSMLETVGEQLEAWRSAGQFPTAVVCGADVYAFAFLEAAQELSIRVPDDLSVIGADDTLPCEYMRPRLTSIRQPFEAMGRAAVRMLMEEIEHKELARSVQRFDVELIERKSCSKCCGNIPA